MRVTFEAHRGTSFSENLTTFVRGLRRLGPFSSSRARLLPNLTSLRSPCRELNEAKDIRFVRGEVVDEDPAVNCVAGGPSGSIESSLATSIR